MNKKLAIVILSFNRIDLLKSNIPRIIDQCKIHDISIWISQDGVTHKIRNFILEMQNEYKNIFFKEHINRVGYDENFISAIKSKDVDYVWVLGDSILINDSGLDKVINIISEFSPSIIGVNADHRPIDFTEKSYSDPNLIFTNFAWHLTYTGSVIYSRESIKKIGFIDFSRFKDFPQIAIIFQSVASGGTFYWVNSNIISSESKKLSYWYSSAIETFITKWTEAIFALPDIYNPKKSEVILKHSEMTGVFSFRSLMKMRYLNYFNIDILNNYNDDLEEHSGLSYPLLYIVAIMPNIIITIVLSIIKIKNKYIKKRDYYKK